MKKLSLIALAVTTLFILGSAVTVQAATCAACTEGMETGNVEEGACTCSKPCDCFAENCPCLWYGCCTELITDEPQAPAPTKKLAQPIIKKEVVTVPPEPVAPAIEKKDRHSCPYCKGSPKAKKCTCSSRCDCIKTKCKCIQEGCQCGTKAVPKETEEINLKINEPFTIFLKTDGTTAHAWQVGSKKLPKWFTVTRIKDEAGITSYELKGTKKGKTTLVMHYIGKGEKKPVEIMRYKIKVEKVKGEKPTKLIEREPIKKTE